MRLTCTEGLFNVTLKPHLSPFPVHTSGLCEVVWVFCPKGWVPSFTQAFLDHPGMDETVVFSPAAQKLMAAPPFP